jgi:hypothetical protein
VRDAKSLVQVQVGNVRAEVTGSAQAHLEQVMIKNETKTKKERDLGIEVRPVHEHLAAGLVDALKMVIKMGK